jgi:hypothetical protein
MVVQSNLSSIYSFMNKYEIKAMKPKYLLFAFLILFTVQKSFGQIPNWNWARGATGNGYDEASTVTTDTFGNVYVSGYFSSDSITIEKITLRNAGLSFNDIFLAKYDPTGNLLWAQRFGGSSNDRGTSITTDKAGNVYLTGYFYSPIIVFGSTTLTNAGNVGDIFVVKFDNQGNVIWARRDGGIGLEIPHSITVDALNNIIVTGRFSSNSITFGTTTLLQAGSMDVFLVKYDPAGNVLWAKGAGGGSNDEGYSVNTDASGNIYVAGYFTQPSNFGTIKLTSEGISDMFLAKYDPSGNVMWAKNAGGKGDDRANAVKTDASGNSYVTGFYTNDSISFGSVIIPNKAVDNSFVAKYDSDGSVIWAKGIGSDCKALDLTIFNSNVYICGTFNADTLTYGSSSLILAGSTDFFLLNCDTNGNPKWAIKQTSDGESSESANSVDTDGSGNVIVAGTFKSEPIIFGASILSSNRGGFDLFVAKLGSVPTGTEDIGKTAEFSIYPNPGNGLFSLKTDGIIYSVDVYTVSGAKIYSLNNIKQQLYTRIDLSEMLPGIYILKANLGGKQFSRKLIIQNQR